MRKRTERIASAVALAGLAPLIGVLATAVAVETRANPFFTQLRVGRDGELFRIFKLRTMSPLAKDAPTHEADSTQITRTGGVLRRYKLDELPQLINVANGTMSLVGPRPCLKEQTELIELRKAAGIDKLAPGITGYGALAGVDMSDPERLVSYDRIHLGRRSWVRDAAVIIGTLSGRGSGDPMTAGTKGDTEARATL